MPLHLTRQFKRAIQNNPATCILVVGAGISKSGVRQGGKGLPDWETLMKDMIEDLRDSGNCSNETLLRLEQFLGKGKYLEIAAEYKRLTRPDQFSLFLGSELDPPDIIRSQLHEQILRIGFFGVATTNFDMVFESQGLLLRPLVYPQFLEDPASIRNERFFMKLHGCIRNTPNPSENLILTEESYQALRKNKKYQTILYTLFLAHPILTVGFSLRDPDFISIIEDLRQIFQGNFPTIYCLMKDPGQESRDAWRAKGIEIVAYENHNELIGFFEEIMQLKNTNITKSVNAISEYLSKVVSCFNECKLNCYGQQPWCRAASEFAITVQYYVLPRLRYSVVDGKLVDQKLDLYLDNWLGDTSRKHLAILGDSGLGKTSACAYLTLRTAKHALNNASLNAPIPLFLSLEHLTRLNLLGESIYTIAQKLFNLSYNDVDEIVNNQGFLFMLDGFDEISDRADHARILKNIDYLKPFLFSGCKTILTSRTHFFADQEQIEQVLMGGPDVGTELYTAFKTQTNDFTIAELKEFSPTEIYELIKKREPTQAEVIWEKMRDLYNLADLSRRPLLLTLILKTLPTLVKKKSKVNSADVYDAYTSFWFKREAERIETTVDVRKKERFVLDLALQMWTKNVIAISFSELQKTVREQYEDEIKSVGDFYVCDYDTRNSSFLNRETDGSYKFMHKSFMEYFVARKCLSSLRNKGKEQEGWSIRWFDKEVANFIAELLQQPKHLCKLKTLVNICLNTDDKTVLWNMLHILSLTEVDIFSEYAGDSALNRFLETAEKETDAVILRQYCRLIAKFGERTKAEVLIKRIIDTVKNDEGQNKNNNETYITYYYGKSSACEALLNHLSTDKPKYDRELHIFVLGEIGEKRHADKLASLIQGWIDIRHLELAKEAFEKIEERTISNAQE